MNQFLSVAIAWHWPITGCGLVAYKISLYRVSQSLVLFSFAFSVSFQSGCWVFFNVSCWWCLYRLW